MVGKRVTGAQNMLRLLSIPLEIPEEEQQEVRNVKKVNKDDRKKKGNRKTKAV